MNPYYERDGITIYCADNREMLPHIGPVSSVVTDPPYGLSFMGKEWDKGVPGVEFWDAVQGAMLPGAHMLAFGGTRTFHRMAVAIEDAGFDIRDVVSWLYGSGFPKSHNLKGEWAGWGTALKPAWEPVIMARKPFAGSVAANVLQHGTGAINVDASRIASPQWFRPASMGGRSGGIMGKDVHRESSESHPAGRFPANVIFDEAAADGHEWSRFFYVAKASRRERGEGNNHPTVKPIALMRYLVQMITPPVGIVLDPFMGSGSTLVAAAELGIPAIGIEMNAEYVEIAARRVDHALNGQQSLPLAAD